MNNKFYQFGTLIEGKEELLTLPNNVVFEHGAWQGFLLGESWGSFYAKLAQENPLWMKRDEAEDNREVQQVIPWTIFRWNNYYLELKKKQEGPHTRLYNKYSLGFGGHVFKHEMDKVGSLDEWIKERFLQEMEYKGNLTVSTLGVVNDNTDELGSGHFGIVYLIEGDSNLVSSRKNLQIRLSPLSEFTGDDVRYWDRWSQMVYRQMRDLEIYNAKQG